ncbi:MAG: SIMPL domain-containing protein [Anaerolineales bacterium]|jgi:uncharacterized protein YggE
MKFIPRKGFALLVLLVLSVAVVSCGTSSTNQPTEPTLVVIGNGTAQQPPDQATVTLGVSYVDTNLSLAISKSNTTIERIHSALIAQQINSEDVRTTGYNVWPEDVYDPETGQPTGVRRFHVDSSVEITIRQLDRVGDIITAGLDAGANNIYGVNFILSDPQSVIDQARTAAIADARDRAEAMAAGFGVQLGKIVSISEGINGVPSPVYNAAVGKGDGVGGGGAGVTVSPGQTTVNVQVYVTYAIAQ